MQIVGWRHGSRRASRGLGPQTGEPSAASSFVALPAGARTEGACAALASTTGAGSSAPLHGSPWYAMPVGVAHLWISEAFPAALPEVETQERAKHAKATRSRAERMPTSAGDGAAMSTGLRVACAFVVGLRLNRG